MQPPPSSSWIVLKKVVKLVTEFLSVPFFDDSLALPNAILVELCFVLEEFLPFIGEVTRLTNTLKAWTLFSSTCCLYCLFSIKPLFISKACPKVISSPLPTPTRKLTLDGTGDTVLAQLCLHFKNLSRNGDLVKYLQNNFLGYLNDNHGLVFSTSSKTISPTGENVLDSE
jgi:hypothetical protein